MTALPTTALDHADVRLRVWFNDGYHEFQQISPDQRLAATPYAMVAGKVDQVLLGAVVAPPVNPVIAWGTNTAGDTVVPSLSDVVSLAASASQSFAVHRDGHVTAWGSGPALPDGLSNVTQIAAGSGHVLALKIGGTIDGWGDNNYGQVSGPESVTNATAVAVGLLHSLVLKADGTVQAFGYAGDGATTIPANLSNVIAIACGQRHSLALKADGSVIAWGLDGNQQVGGSRGVVGTVINSNDTTLQLSKILPAGSGTLYYDGPEGEVELSYTSDGSDTLTVTGDTGALSQGMSVRSGAVVGPAGLTNVVGIAAGEFHSLAVISDGTVVAWGKSDGGECTPPVGLNGVSKVAAGSNYSLALKTDGTLVTWPSTGNTNPIKTIPANTTQITSIAGGSSHALALRAELVSAQLARLDQNNVFAGKVAIGITPGTNALEVNGNASKSSAGAWLSNSDRRIKADIESISGALEKLDQVRLVDFRYTEDYLAAHPEIEDRRYPNVIAQEFAQVFPNEVKSSGETLPDGSEILQVDTYPLTIYSAAAVQELHRENQQQHRENKLLRGKIAGLEERLRKIEESLKDK
jgi:alpha-tubulin suppressor-like RCC1 family protein